MFRIVTLCFLLGLAAGSARAQSHVYIGPQSECTNMGMQSNAWQCELNWSANTAPGASSTVSIGAATVTGVFSSASVLGLILNGTSLQTAGSLQINDTFVWDGGTINTLGTISVVGNATLQGGGKVLQGTDLRVEGTGIVTWTEGGIALDSESAVDVRGAFDARADGATLSGPTFVIRANALLTRTMDPGTTTIGATVTNEGGQIDVRTGTLEINGATLQGGTYNAEAGATLHFTRFGPYTFSGTLGGEPDGSILLDNGQMVIALNGPTTLGIGGTGLEWQDGFFDMGGETLTNTGLLVLTEFHDLDNGTLRNEGTVRWEAGNNLLANFTIENAGLFDLQGDGQVFGGTNNPLFLNAEGGTLRRSVGTGNVNVGIPITNASGGTIDLVTDALFLSSNSSLDLQPGSHLQGTGTLNKGFTNGVTFGGIVAPGTSPGVLNWIGDAFFPFNPAASAVLEIELAGPTSGTDFDQLAVTGPAILDGTLRVTLLDSFEPEEGDRFLIVPATGGATGVFADLDLPDGMTATVEVSGAGAELVIGPPVANEGEADLPTAFALYAPYPNPALAQAALRYDLPESSSVRLTVYDVLGREVAVLVDEERPIGTHTAVLNGQDLARGLYMVRLAANGYHSTRRLTLIR